MFMQHIIVHRLTNVHYIVVGVPPGEGEVAGRTPSTVRRSLWSADNYRLDEATGLVTRVEEPLAAPSEGKIMSYC